eukprot:COSAG01_NODE_26173_length_721_cov_22.938907_2_plen_42_part_01
MPVDQKLLTDRLGQMSSNKRRRLVYCVVARWVEWVEEQCVLF